MDSRSENRVRQRRAAAFLVLWLVVSGAASAASAPPKGKEDPASDAPRPVDEAPSRLIVKSELYETPAACRKPDGTFDQPALVEHQKGRLEKINKRLGINLGMAETKHYLIFSNADAAMTGNFIKWCEALHANLCSQFGIPTGERVWDGKCLLLLFNSRVAFTMYAQTFDKYSAARAGAYLAAENLTPAGPNLLHICMPLDERNIRYHQEIFAHEGTHAFFMLYRTPGRLPRWLNEGLAEYMTTVNDSSLRAKKLRPASEYARKSFSISHVFEERGVYGLNWEDYSVCFTLVDFLLRAGRPKFKKFVDGLKDGKDQETALKAAYGFSIADLERRWQIYMEDYIRKYR